MSVEAKEKAYQLAVKADELNERAQSAISNGPPKAQAARLMAVFILQNSNLVALMEHVNKATDWSPQTPEQAAEEAEVASGFGAAIERYSAAVRGVQAPLYSRVEFEEVWTRSTSTSAEAIDPYFALLVEVIVPQIESIVQRAEQLLAEADALTAA